MFAETFRHTPFRVVRLHLSCHRLLLCYNIFNGVDMPTSLFSLSAPVRLSLTLALIVLLALAVRWAVQLP